MVFEDNNEFNVELYDKEFNELFETFKVVVKLIKYNDNKTEYLQGDFLGIKTKTFSDDPHFIEICIMNQNQKVSISEKQGYNEKGLVFDAVVKKSVNITNKDIIQFIEYDYDNKILMSDTVPKFKIEIDSSANFKLQTSFKKIKLIRI